MMLSVRNYFPGARIILVTKHSTRFEELFKTGDSPVNDVLYYEKGLENYINLLKRLQDERIDLAVVPSTVVFSGTNHLIAYHSKAGITAGVRSLDYEKNPVWYLLKVKNDFVWGVKKVHQVERNLDIIRQLKINPAVTRLSLKLTNESELRADMFFRRYFQGSTKKMIGFHPGAGKESNIWPPEKFAELAFRLSSKFGTNIVISEGPSDEKYVNRMKDTLQGVYGIKDAAVHKGELMTNAAVVNRLTLFVTNDTGMMHVAGGLKTPLVAIFGETMAYEWGPLGENKLSVQSPAGNIAGISVDSVFDICCNLLK
jgi:heptosyltransferase-2